MVACIFTHHIAKAGLKHDNVILKGNYFVFLKMASFFLFLLFLKKEEGSGEKRPRGRPRKWVSLL